MTEMLGCSFVNHRYFELDIAVSKKVMLVNSNVIVDSPCTDIFIVNVLLHAEQKLPLMLSDYSRPLCCIHAVS